MKINLLIIVLSILVIGCNSSILDDPTVTIKFSVAETSNVLLTVDNSYDTRIATLIDEELQAGAYQASFDASNLAEGIYFYTLELKGISGSYSKSTKNMLLIK
jgi:hypothetical protein